VDTYRNLSYKSMFGYLWASTFCKQADFVIKTDDDMFIDLFQVYHITRPYLTSEEYRRSSFFLCPRWAGAKPQRDPNDKYFVSKEDFAGSEYPPYCWGWMYVTSPGTAARLLEAAKVNKFMWLEDIWITGILAEKVNISHNSIMNLVSLRRPGMLFVKSVQNPVTYHQDFLAGPTEKDRSMAKTLFRHAKWCYEVKCKNNIYYGNGRVEEEERVADIALRRAHRDFDCHKCPRP